MTVTIVDPVAALREILLERAIGTSLADVPVHTRRQDAEPPPFILVGEGGLVHHRSAPVYNPARVGFTAWTLTEEQAVELYLTAAQLLHRYGPVVREGVGVFRIFEETGMQQPFPDPDTGWWRAFGVFDLVMVDRIVT